MKHGPIALIDSDMPVVVIATHNFMYEKVLSNIQEIKARKDVSLLSLARATRLSPRLPTK